MIDGERTGGGYRPGYEVVAEQVLELIARLGLRPGDRMPTENDLARQLGTSRTVVREAVKILSALGRVRAQRGRGLYVADDQGMLGSGRWASFFLPTDLDHVYMLFEFRRTQEMATSRLAAGRATPAEVQAIEKAAAVCRQGFDTGRDDLFNEGDDAFHTSIAVASHNVFLQVAVREARRLQAQSNLIGLRGSVGGHAAKAIEEHETICQAIRAGDAEAAAAAAATHIDNTLDDYRREIQQRIFSAADRQPSTAAAREAVPGEGSRTTSIGAGTPSPPSAGVGG
ncbi:FadR/GntR family transcriptional regulator [Micromonospora sp. KC721]|uniref:FadR/GntR family transcriptional regulator n=1 Tax=Micromonospora sp. KC721 TaxID=2530380 RepID=UPI001FB754E9|nr:FCD domain-containing protein [Micromonospora sp. KC721]